MIPFSRPNSLHIKSRLALAAFAVLCVGASHQAHAAASGWNQTTGATWDYNDAANWVGGTINGLWDSSLLLTVNQNLTFAADTVLTGGLTFNYDGSFNETLRGTGADRMLTLSGDILVNTISTTRTITLGNATAGLNLNVNLGGQTRTFTVGTGRSLGFVNVISNGGIIASGGTLNFSGTNTYTGTTTINSGVFSLNGATGSSAFSDFTLKPGTGSTPTLTFNSSTSGNLGTTRAKSVVLNGVGSSGGVVLTVSGNSTVNSVETITNALGAGGGFGTVTLTPNALKNARLDAGSFARSLGSAILFRGTNLGVNSILSQTAGSANIQFGGTVALSGSGTAGQSTVGIIKGAYGDITTAGTGSGLVTYDSTNGVRLLDTTTEYIAVIANGQTQADNVRYARASGGAAQDINLTSATTTIHSLSFKITGAGTNSGVTISGDPGTMLRLNSGVIFASQTVTTAAATDAMTVSVPTLDLNGQEGVILAFTSGISNGNTAAPLQINSSIANDGGNGVTIGGTGEVIFGGATAHTYTGVTTINSGILRLNKSVINIGIPGDLVMNGGTLLKTGNAIPDTASVTINGGAFVFDSTTSSGNNNHPETINNFTMNGGSVSNHGTGATFTINGNATLNAGQLVMNQGGDVTVLGTTTLSGGLLTAKESTSTTAFNGLTTLNGVTITNPASGAYTPLTLTAHATNFGAKLTLNGDVTFTGNGTNTNTALVTSSDGALANQGIIALEGARIFNIGNGAAAVDLSIAPSMVNGVSTGGLTKAGNGTLALLGLSTFTGATTVDAGTLLISGSLSGSAVAVNAGTLGGSGIITSGVTIGNGAGSADAILSPGSGIGTLTTGSVTFASDAAFALELNTSALTTDLLTTSGTISLGLGVIPLTAFDFGSATLSGGQTFTFIHAGGGVSGTFAGLAEGASLSVGATGFTISYAANSGQDVVLTAVPEPGSCALLLGGLGLLARRRRAAMI